MKTILLSVAVLVLGSGMLWAQVQTNTNQDKSKQADQIPPAAQSGQPSPQAEPSQPVTGKTGNKSTHINTSTTGSAGQETPGVQTNLGIQQQPGKHAEGKAPNAPKHTPRTDMSGAPPNWEQVGQDPESANKGAAAASRAEIGGEGGGTLGVNAEPQYDKNANTRQDGPAKKSNASKGKKRATKPPQQQQSQPPQ